MNTDEKEQPCPACGSEDAAGTNLRILPTGFYCARATGDEEHRRAIIAARPELAPEAAAQNGNGTCGPFSLGSGLSAIGVDAEPSGAELDFTRLDKGRFDVNHPPEKPVPVISLCGQGLSTPGNLTVVSAQMKAAKTSAIMAALASMMTPKGDCLGFTGTWTGGAWIHFDSEQSPFDFDKAIRVALRRAGIDAPPVWLRSYSTVHLDIDERREMFFAELERAYKEHGRLSGASADGVADMCHDPNDSAEAFALVSRLNRAAAQYACPIIVSLHENPGSENGKTRGHLGSELARKAETNLSLVKDADGIVTMFSERSRSNHIPKANGPRFQWADVAGMHLSCGTRREKRRDATAQKHYETAVGVFGNDLAKSMSWAELIAALAPIAGNEKNAENRISAMKKYEVIRYDFGVYRLCSPQP